jgi:hypothetical protein
MTWTPSISRRFLGCILAAVIAIAAPSACKAQSYPPAWNSAATYAPGDQVQENGNIYRAVKSVTPGQDPAVSYGSWELNFVRTNTTLLIGSGETFPTLALAWGYILNARVADGAYLHLYIATTHANFSESFTAPFSLDHGSGSRISILGDNRANIDLTFSASGFTIDSGHVFGTLSGLTVATSSGGYGLTASQEATIASIAEMTFSGCATAVYASLGANLTFSNSIDLAGCVNGFTSDQAMIKIATGMTIAGTGTAKGTGLYAIDNGSIVAPGCAVSEFEHGIWAESNGSILAPSTSATHCLYGVNADQRAYVSLNEGTTNNCYRDFVVEYGAYVDANGVSTPDGVQLAAYGIIG